MEVEVQQGPCMACLYEDELNNQGLCDSCVPTDLEFGRVLLDLLSQPHKLELQEENR